MTREESGLAARARRYGSDAARAFELAPVEVSLALLLAIGFSIAIEQHEEPTAWLELAAVAALAAAAAWTGTLLHALGTISVRTRLLITLAGAVVATLYGQFVIDLTLLSEAWRAAALVAAAALWIFALPAFGGPRASATDRFRLVNGRFLLRCLGVLLYAAALFAGLALALAAIDNLFELDLEGEIYGHVFGWIFLVLVTWVVVGGLPDFVKPAGATDQVASVVHRISAYLVPPLVAVYFVILYAYAVRIGLTGEVPKNLVSPLVLLAGVMGALALMLYDPAPADRAPFRALRATAPLFIPLAVLGSWTVLTRVGQYGWTEFRMLRLLLLVALGVLAIGAVFELVRKRRFSLHLVPLALAVAAVLAVVGPWSVLEVSRRSQQARLGTALAEVGVPTDGPAAPRDTVVDDRTYEHIRSTSLYLLRHFGADALPPVLARHARGADRWTDLAARIGLRGEHMRETSMVRGLHARLQPAVPIHGGELYFFVLEQSRHGRDVAVSGPGIRSDSTRLWLSTGIGELSVDLAGIQAGMHNGVLAPASARLPAVDAGGRERGELLVLEVSFSPGGARRLDRLQAVLRVTVP